MPKVKGKSLKGKGICHPVCVLVDGYAYTCNPAFAKYLR